MCMLECETTVEGCAMAVMNMGEYAEMTGFNRETIKNRLVDVPYETGPRASRLYDSRAALPAIYQIGKLDKTVDLTQARANLAVKQASKIDMDMELKRGDFIVRSEAKDGIIAVFTAFRSKMLGLPTKSVPRLKTATSEAEKEQILLELVHDALKELKTPDVLLGGVPEPAGRVSAVTGPATKTNRK